MTVTLHTGYGGLGDNLMFSTLPELYASNGIDCYISNANPYRNSGIKELVWDMNPYIKGTQDLTREECVGHSITGWIYTPAINGFIENVEHLHGFNPVNSYPKIYYRGSPPSMLQGKVIVDLSAVTRSFDKQFIDEAYVTSYLTEVYSYHIDDIVFLKFPHLYGDTVNQNTHLVNNLFEYVDILSGCEHYISLHSGGNMLACAVKNSTLAFINECIISADVYNGLLNNGQQALFNNCNYLIWQ